jgi:hypothetical protein
MHDAARRKLGWIIGQWCHAETVVCRPLWLNKFTLLMMKPAIRGEVLMADGPEMYRLYIECRNCKHEIALKKVWGPRPDRPPLTALAVQLHAQGAISRRFTRLLTSDWGILTQMSNTHSLTSFEYRHNRRRPPK